MPRHEGERWSRKKASGPDVTGFCKMPKVDSFLKDIVEVCARHGMSISHEDTHGGFIIEEFDKKLVDWLMEASAGDSIEPTSESDA